MMLQQTQVDRVIPKYEAFLERFPTIEALARAGTKDVLTLWSGLGYNRRALYLKKCAETIMKDYKGQFPEDEEKLLLLPGIGPYTAAAVLSFAFNKDIIVIDVNIEVLFKRLFYWNDVKMSAESSLPSGRSRDWHNALMDIGAVYCTAVNPNCNDCPLQRECDSAFDTEKIESTWTKKKVVPFKQSDRIVRGNILKMLTQNDGLVIDDVYDSLIGQGIERDRVIFDSILEALAKEGLVVIKKENVWLP